MFRTQEEEVMELAKELRELKDVLREISSKVTQIEARVKRTFAATFPKGTAGRRFPGPKVTDPPTISPQEALKVYNDLVGMAKQGNKGEVQRRLEIMGLPDLALLSRELGVSLGKSKPSRKTLLNGVLGRINESIMLSTSSLRQAPDRAERGIDEANSGLKQTDRRGSIQDSGSPAKDEVG